MKAENEDGIYDVTDMPMPSLRGHAWRQYGNKIECQSCSVPHAVFLQPGTYISGYDEGIPVVSRITTRLSSPPLGDGSVSTPDQQLDTKPRPAS